MNVNVPVNVCMYPYYQDHMNVCMYIPMNGDRD